MIRPEDRAVRGPQGPLAMGIFGAHGTGCNGTPSSPRSCRWAPGSCVRTRTSSACWPAWPQACRASPWRSASRSRIPTARRARRNRRACRRSTTSRRRASPIAGSFDDYWNARGKNLRQNMKKQRAKLQKDGVATRLETLTRAEDVAAGHRGLRPPRKRGLEGRRRHRDTSGQRAGPLLPRHARSLLPRGRGPHLPLPVRRPRGRHRSLHRRRRRARHPQDHLRRIDQDDLARVPDARGSVQAALRGAQGEAHRVLRQGDGVAHALDRRRAHALSRQLLSLPAGAEAEDTPRVSAGWAIRAAGRR